jgi:hypothetical protein
VQTWFHAAKISANAFIWKHLRFRNMMMTKEKTEHLLQAWTDC